MDYLLAEGEIGYGVYKFDTYQDQKDPLIHLKDGRVIMSVYSKNLKNLEKDKSYQLIYVSVGGLVVSVEQYPFSDFYIFEKNYTTFLVIISFVLVIYAYTRLKLNVE